MRFSSPGLMHACDQQIVAKNVLGMSDILYLSALLCNPSRTDILPQEWALFGIPVRTHIEG